MGIWSQLGQGCVVFDSNPAPQRGNIRNSFLIAPALKILNRTHKTKEENRFEYQAPRPPFIFKFMKEVFK